MRTDFWKSRICICLQKHGIMPDNHALQTAPSLNHSHRCQAGLTADLSESAM